MKVSKSQKTSANQAVSKSLVNGFLRPEICTICGSYHSRQLRYPKIVAHHWSYLEEHWLDVIWCCSKCHKDIHLDRIDVLNKKQTGVYTEPVGVSDVLVENVNDIFKKTGGFEQGFTQRSYIIFAKVKVDGKVKHAKAIKKNGKPWTMIDCNNQLRKINLTNHKASEVLGLSKSYLKQVQYRYVSLNNQLEQELNRLENESDNEMAIKIAKALNCKVEDVFSINENEGM